MLDEATHSVLHYKASTCHQWNNTEETLKSTLWISRFKFRFWLCHINHMQRLIILLLMMHRRCWWAFNWKLLSDNHVWNLVIKADGIWHGSWWHCSNHSRWGEIWNLSNSNKWFRKSGPMMGPVYQDLRIQTEPIHILWLAHKRKRKAKNLVKQQKKIWPHQLLSLSRIQFGQMLIHIWWTKIIYTSTVWHFIHQCHSIGHKTICFCVWL